MDRFALLCLFFLILLASSTWAQEPAKEPEEPDPPYSMPTEDIFTPDELNTKFEYRKAKPFGDESLALVLPCRSAWKWVDLKHPVKADTEHLVPLARVEPYDDRDVSIEMKYVVLPREVKLEDWIDFFVDTQSMHVLHAQRGTYHERRVLDILAEFKVQDGRTYVARAGFFKAGNRIWMIAGSAPEDKYEQYAGDFGLAVTAATPVLLSTDEFAETMKEYRFPVGRKFSFTYPASWTLVEIADLPPGIGAVDICWEGTSKPVGLIKVRTYLKERVDGIDVQKVSWSVFEEIKGLDKDFEILEKIQELESDTPLFPGPGKMCVYRISLQGTPLELHELVLDSPDALFAIYLITPSREQAPRLWMINHRAWEIVGMQIRGAS